MMFESHNGAVNIQVEEHATNIYDLVSYQLDNWIESNLIETTYYSGFEKVRGEVYHKIKVEPAEDEQVGRVQLRGAIREFGLSTDEDRVFTETHVEKIEFDPNKWTTAFVFIDFE